METGDRDGMGIRRYREGRFSRNSIKFTFHLNAVLPVSGSLRSVMVDCNMVIQSDTILRVCGKRSLIVKSVCHNEEWMVRFFFFIRGWRYVFH